MASHKHASTLNNHGRYDGTGARPWDQKLKWIDEPDEPIPRKLASLLAVATVAQNGGIRELPWAGGQGSPESNISILKSGPKKPSQPRYLSMVERTTPVLPAAIHVGRREGERNGNPSYLINLNFKLTSPVLQGRGDECVSNLGWIAAEDQAALTHASGNERAGRLRIDAERWRLRFEMGYVPGGFSAVFSGAEAIAEAIAQPSRELAQMPASTLRCRRVGLQERKSDRGREEESEVEGGK